MATKITISPSSDRNYALVNATEKNGYTRYYSVPNKNARVFAAELKQQNKDFKIISNTTFFSAIFLGVLGATAFTKKFESKMKQFLIHTAVGVSCAALSSLGFNEYATAQEENLMKKHRAKEIFYRT